MSAFGEPVSIGQLIKELKKLDPNEELSERYRRFLRDESTLSRIDYLKSLVAARDQKRAGNQLSKYAA